MGLMTSGVPWKAQSAFQALLGRNIGWRDSDELLALIDAAREADEEFWEYACHEGERDAAEDGLQAHAELLPTRVEEAETESRSALGDIGPAAPEELRIESEEEADRHRGHLEIGRAHV